MILQGLLERLDNYNKLSPFTWVYGLGRSLLALGLLITFVFSSTEVLFDEALFGYHSLGTVLDKINLFFLLGYENLVWGKVIGIIVCLAVISGYFIRLTGVLHFWVCFSFQHAASILEGGDQIAALLTLLILPLTLLDDRKNHWYNTSKLENNAVKYIGNIIVEFLIPIQMAVIYFHAAVEKLYMLDEWKEGTAIYYFMNDPLFGSPVWLDPILNFIYDHGFLLSTATWGVILLELSLAGALFMTYKRKKYLYPLAVGFHFSIILVFGLVSFFFAMVGGATIFLINKNYQLKWKPFRLPKLAKYEILHTIKYPVIYK